MVRPGLLLCFALACGACSSTKGAGTAEVLERGKEVDEATEILDKAESLVDPGEEPLYRPPPPASALPGGELWRTARAADFAALIEELAEADVVYLGESHTNPDHHAIQLLVIEYLWDRGRLHGIGMEMFQRKFQPALDAYVAGEIDEGELLARTEWKKRWGFDFALYRPILEFARLKRIPVIALNVEREIRMALREHGLEGMPQEMRDTLPALDTSRADHRAYLREVYAAHVPEGKEIDEEKFEKFYLAMCLWDDVMADTIVRWFRTAPPEAQMAVVVGAGHVANRYGIPDRAEQRGGKIHKTLVLRETPADGARPEAALFAQSHADFVWFTPARPQEKPEH